MTLTQLAQGARVTARLLEVLDENHTDKTPEEVANFLLTVQNRLERLVNDVSVMREEMIELQKEWQVS